jgi:hypothetical protein
MRGTPAIVNYAEVVLYVMGGQNIIYHFKHVEIVVNLYIYFAIIPIKFGIIATFIHKSLENNNCVVGT